MSHRILDLDGAFKIIIPPILNIYKKMRQKILENYQRNLETEFHQMAGLQASSFSPFFFVMLTSSASHLLSLRPCFQLSLAFPLCCTPIDSLISMLIFCIHSVNTFEFLPYAQHCFVGGQYSTEPNRLSVFPHRTYVLPVSGHVEPR